MGKKLKLYAFRGNTVYDVSNCPAIVRIFLSSVDGILAQRNDPYTKNRPYAVKVSEPDLMALNMAAFRSKVVMRDLVRKDGSLIPLGIYSYPNKLANPILVIESIDVEPVKVDEDGNNNE